MRHRSNISRRIVLGGLALAPVLPEIASASTSSGADKELIQWGRELEDAHAAVEFAGTSEQVEALFEKQDKPIAAIVARRATSLEGLHVKARATAWAIESDLGILDPNEETTAHLRVAASLVRDLLAIGQKGFNGRA